jgi:hypothetical protein
MQTQAGPGALEPLAGGWGGDAQDLSGQLDAEVVPVHEGDELSVGLGEIRQGPADPGRAFGWVIDGDTDRGTQRVGGPQAAGVTPSVIGQATPGRGEEPPQSGLIVNGNIGDPPPGGDQDGLEHIRGVGLIAATASQLGQDPGTVGLGQLLQASLVGAHWSGSATVGGLASVSRPRQLTW